MPARLIVGLTLAFSLSLPASAAEQTVTEESSLLFPMRLVGTVSDVEGEPLVGVSVKVFIDGSEEAVSRTDSIGSYRLAFSIDPNRDETVVVCCIAPRTDLIGEFALIRESRSDRAGRLWSPCIPRLGVGIEREWSVRLVDRSTWRDQLVRSGCLP